MVDFRLKVFIAVADHLSFTKASRELYISQPAISRHIKELESVYSIQLFERVGGSRIRLTAAGRLFLSHARHIVESYAALSSDMNLLRSHFSGELRIGASTTIAQYALPQVIASFIARFSEVKLTLHTGNTEQIEQLVTEHRIDLGLVEGSSRKRDFSYSLFSRDELVLVTSSQTKSVDAVNVEELKALPLVLRESGSGTLEVIEDYLERCNVKLSDLHILLNLGSSESIKQFLFNSSAYALISVAAITRELLDGRLKIVDISDLKMERNFSFISAVGSRNEIAEKFILFSDDYHNHRL